MRLGDIYGIPKEQEFPFGKLKFSPINIDYWIRLERDYGKTIEDFANTAPDNPLRTLDVLLSMLHCATYPYVKEEHTFDSWMDVLAQYATAYPVLVEWFLLYVNDSLAPPDGKKGKVSRPKS